MEVDSGKIRIDKWLWAVRLFKSRSSASEACDKGKVKIGDQPVKASRNIRVGEVITIRRRAFTMQFKILQLTENRQPAKSVSDFYKDITPEEDVEKMKIHSIETRAYRNSGEGRPTKKDRRELDEFISETSF
jgi:ribosome-associated heat shock protein Hsp15